MTAPAPTQARCTRPGSPTCLLPNIHTAHRNDSHTCRHCRRVWHVTMSTGKQPYWRWNGTEYAKATRR